MDTNFIMYCFANCVNDEYRFIKKSENGEIILIKDRISPGVKINTSLFNPIIFESMPVNRVCSLKQVLNGYKIGSSDRGYYYPTGIHYTYPYNLIVTIMSDCDDNLDKYIWFEMTDDRWKGLNYALSKLSERERIVVDLYFNKEVRSAEIADKFNLTRCRIDQIRNKAVRKLRHPVNLRYILYGYDIASGYIRQKEEELRQKEIDAANKSIDDKINKINNGDRFKQITISDLNLSTRSYNCLLRAGFLTLYDLSKMSASDFMSIRNLGRQSLLEIIDILKEYGITIEGE